MESFVKWCLRTFAVPRWAEGALPTLDGEYIGVPGLSAPGHIKRDKYGVPHIEASNACDAIALLGFCHAQDRLWQMEQTRRLGKGRMSEIFGKDAVAVDMFARKIGWLAMAQADLLVEEEAAAQGAPGLAILKAYSAGVNAGVQSLGALPWEFRLLGIAACEPWAPVDTLVVFRVVFFNMSFGWQGPVLRTWMRDVMGDEAADEWQMPVCPVDSTDPASNRTTVGPSTPLVEVSLYDSSLPPLPEPVNIASMVGAAVGLTPGGPEAAGNGSNWYGVSGQYTASGGALFATDPHLAVNLPGFWYEAHMRGEADGWHVAGGGVPGMPFVLNGHNEHCCWGMTLSFAQMEDVFLERVKWDEGGGLTYEHMGETKQADHRVEAIDVKGEKAPRMLHVYTTVHGVLISGDTGCAPSRRETDVTGVCVCVCMCVCVCARAMRYVVGITDEKRKRH